MALGCIVELYSPSAYLSCLSTLEPVAWAAIFIGGTVLVSGGWMWGLKDFGAGLSVGGFMMTLVALMLFLLEIIEFGILLIPLVLMLVGVVFLVIEANKT